MLTEISDTAQVIQVCYKRFENCGVLFPQTWNLFEGRVIKHGVPRCPQ